MKRMKTIKLILIASALFFTAGVVSAGEKVAILAVEGMTCASCPYQVEKALTKVAGVKKATVAIETHEASVTYDDTQTNVVALTEATGNAGFPSSAKASN
ncbi:MAG: mercury resistance system periplasmic binding protein MerP [Gammaproteobacteria bacterium]|nr:mercury resistance system periplasmic binding protein MerP [Gammaproteobacteria bacterium]